MHWCTWTPAREGVSVGSWSGGSPPSCRGSRSCRWRTSVLFVGWCTAVFEIYFHTISTTPPLLPGPRGPAGGGRLQLSAWWQGRTVSVLTLYSHLDSPYVASVITWYQLSCVMQLYCEDRRDIRRNMARAQRKSQVENTRVFLRVYYNGNFSLWMWMHLFAPPLLV